VQILARGIEFDGRHGATAAERRAAPRRFQVDVELTLPEVRATETDRLADTVDYHGICALVVEIGTSGTCRLLETLAARMGMAIRKLHPEVEAVLIEVRKLHPPCPGNPAYTAVRLTLPAKPPG
jgi:dihydroneopterin aldolase